MERGRCISPLLIVNWSLAQVTSLLPDTLETVSQWVTLIVATHAFWPLGLSPFQHTPFSCGRSCRRLEGKHAAVERCAPVDRVR